MTTRLRSVLVTAVAAAALSGLAAPGTAMATEPAIGANDDRAWFGDQGTGPEWGNNQGTGPEWGNNQGTGPEWGNNQGTGPEWR